MHGPESMHELDPGDDCGLEERLQRKILSKKVDKA